MHIKHHYDDLLDASFGATLGKTLIAFQALEQSLTQLIQRMITIDYLDAAKEWQQGSASKKTELLLVAEKRLRNGLGISEGSPTNGTYFFGGAADTDLIRSKAPTVFASLRRDLTRARQLLQKRNTIVHGRLKLETDGCLRFLARRDQVPASEQVIEGLRNEALGVAIALMAGADSLGKIFEAYGLRAWGAEQPASDEDRSAGGLAP